MTITFPQGYQLWLIDVGTGEFGRIVGWTECEPCSDDAPAETRICCPVVEYGQDAMTEQAGIGVGVARVVHDIGNTCRTYTSVSDVKLRARDIISRKRAAAGKVAA